MTCLSLLRQALFIPGEKFEKTLDKLRSLLYNSEAV